MQITEQLSDEPTDPRRLLKAGLANCAGLRLVWRDGSEFNSGNYSGFAMKIGEHWLWCSAGHCVKQIEHAASDPAIAHVLLETFVDGRPAGCIAARIKGASMAWIDEEDGLDIGCIVLDKWYAEQLESNGVIPIGPREVCSPELETIGHVLIGLPGQYSKFEVVHGVGVTHDAPVPVMLSRDRDREDEEITKLRFTWTGPGIVTEAGALESIAGMSGGLVYALFTLPGGIVGLAPLAVQSSWDPKKRRLSATPLTAFAQVFELANKAAETTANPRADESTEGGSRSDRERKSSVRVTALPKIVNGTALLM